MQARKVARLLVWFCTGACPATYTCMPDEDWDVVAYTTRNAVVMSAIILRNTQKQGACTVLSALKFCEMSRAG